MNLIILVSIESLPPIYRQVLMMRDVEEMTGLEVAVALGLTMSTVKSRLSRSRNMLRPALNIKLKNQQTKLSRQRIASTKFWTMMKPLKLLKYKNYIKMDKIIELEILPCTLDNPI